MWGRRHERCWTARSAGLLGSESVYGDLVVVDDVAAEFAERFVEAFHARPGERFSVALSGGDTARQCYERLADDGGHELDWRNVDVLWGDERCVPLDDPKSNARLAREAFLSKVGASSVHPMSCDDVEGY